MSSSGVGLECIMYRYEVEVLVGWGFRVFDVLVYFRGRKIRGCLIFEEIYVFRWVDCIRGVFDII